MRFSLALLALLPSTVFGALSINGPNPQSYWVQNTSNLITWQFTTGDPSPVDILVVNADNATLNGEFSIAQFVDTSVETLTVTNVTLKVGSGFQIQFVSPKNHSQVFATSQNFDVKPSGTGPAPGTSGSNTNTTASSSGASSNAASPTPTVHQRPPPAPADNGATSALGSAGVFGAMLACGIASLAVLL